MVQREAAADSRELNVSWHNYRRALAPKDPRSGACGARAANRLRGRRLRRITSDSTALNISGSGRRSSSDIGLHVCPRDNREASGVPGPVVDKEVGSEGGGSQARG
jgi:hypothetical protein